MKVIYILVVLTKGDIYKKKPIIPLLSVSFRKIKFKSKIKNILKFTETKSKFGSSGRNLSSNTKETSNYLKPLLSNMLSALLSFSDFSAICIIYN